MYAPVWKKAEHKILNKTANQGMCYVLINDEQSLALYTIVHSFDSTYLVSLGQNAFFLCHWVAKEKNPMTEKSSTYHMHPIFQIFHLEGPNLIDWNVLYWNKDNIREVSYKGGRGSNKVHRVKGKDAWQGRSPTVLSRVSRSIRG